MRNLAIIPARSGSKGLKDKNIKELLGKPMIGYSIEAALDSGVFDEVMVSTDSEIYAAIAKECGASVPFLRSESNASDGATSWDTVREVLEGYKKLGKEFDTVCLLQPTSPLRVAQDIVSAYEIYEDKNANTVIGVCETEHSPLWENTLPEDGAMDEFISKDDSLRRQLLPTYYRINGAMYIVKVEKILESNDIYEKSYAYVMPTSRSIDIDTELDFIIAEKVMEYYRSKS